MSQEIIKFQAIDGVSLDGYINKCDIKTNKVLIQIHGMTSNCFRNRESAISNAVGQIGIDTLCFNNRGSEVAKLIKGNDGIPRLAGTAYEEISESYYDICGAIKFVIERGYDEIFLQGHSLGSTKIVYVYNRLLKEESEFVKNIKALILLSLVDLPMVMNYFGKRFIPYAEELLSKGQGNVIMHEEAFPYPLSAKTFLRYAKNGEDIDFAKYGNDADDFQVINSFKIPLFFRWGNVNEIMLLDANTQVDFVKNKIHNSKLDVGYIDGANHSYFGKENQLAQEIVNFLNNIK